MDDLGVPPPFWKTQKFFAGKMFGEHETHPSHFCWYDGDGLWRVPHSLLMAVGLVKLQHMAKKITLITLDTEG